MTDIWLFYYFADLAAKCLFSPILGVFLGVWPPKCSRILSRPQKAHPWPETRVLAYGSCRSVKKCYWTRAEESEKKTGRKKEKKLRCDKPHICPDHPRCATPTKVVMWGGVPDVVNHAKFHQSVKGIWLQLRGQNLPFSYVWRYGLYNRLGLPPNLWYVHLRERETQHKNVTTCSVLAYSFDAALHNVYFRKDFCVKAWSYSVWR